MADKIVNYPSNSHADRHGTAPKEKTEPEKPTQIAQAVQRKKTVGRRIMESFTGDDAQSVGSYLLFDVFIPAAKNFLMDAASQGVERILFGDSRPRSSSSRSGYTNYSNYSRPSSPTPRISYAGARDRDEPRMGAHHTFDFNDILLPTRGDAEAVLDELRGQLMKYDVATVSDLYHMVGLSSEFTYDKWGWNNLEQARIAMTRHGYILDLPRPEPLN